MREYIDKTDVAPGTPINRVHMMALQGFDGATTVFNQNGSITETFADGVKTTVFNDNGSITETFVGKKTIIKTTTFNADGSIKETII